MENTGRTTGRSRWVAALTIGALFATANIASADNVNNSLTSGGPAARTTAPNVTLTATYSIHKTGQACDPEEGEPAVVTITAPTGVTATPSSLTFTSCGTNQSVSFSSATVGSYAIAHTITDADTPADTYNNNANFTLIVAVPTVADTAPPTWDCSPATADSDWHATNQSSSCTARDAATGPATPESFTLSTSVADGLEYANASTGTQQVCDAVSPSANCATAGPITGWKIDRKAPVVTDLGPTSSSNAAGWYRTDVTNTFAASDGGSGLASGTTSPFTKVTSGEGEAVTVASGAVLDAVGNRNDGIDSAAFKIDKTAPTVTCPSSAPSFILNQPSASVTASVADVLSGPASSTATVTVSTGNLGTWSVAVTGADVAGNTTTVNCSFTVGARASAFGQPVDNGNVLNKAKAGRAVPLKWRLTDYNGDPVSNLAGGSVQVKAVGVSCSLGTTADLVEEYSADGSGLQNLGDGYYQWDWKSPTSYLNSCKQVTIQLPGGGGPTALFNFTK